MPSTGPAPSRADGRRRWVVAFVLFAALSGAWGLSVPIMSGPDEHAHAIKAAAVAHGSLSAVDRASVPHVAAPEVYTRAQTYECYVHRPAVTAECAPAFTGDDELVEVPTLAGRYPPLYYALVGGPSVPFPSLTGVYLSRLLSAALSAAFLATALSSAVIAGRRGWPVLGLAAATTPVALYLSGTINPNGFEIAGCICLWASAVALALDPTGPRRTTLVVRIAVSAVLVCLTRGLSPMWVLLVLGVVVLLLGAGPLLGLLRQRVVQFAALATGLAGAVGAIGVATAGLVPGTGVSLTLTERLRTSSGRVPTFLSQTVGGFGFLDAPTPALTPLLWFAVTTTLLVVGLASAPLRGREGRPLRALLVLLVIVVVLPVVLEVLQTNSIGLFWQGRYQLPVAVGVPLLAAVCCSWSGLDVRRLAAVALPLLAVAHVAAYLFVVRRYAVGVDGPLVYLLDPQWSPPLPLPLLALVFVAAATGLAVLFGRTIAGQAEGAGDRTERPGAERPGAERAGAERPGADEGRGAGRPGTAQTTADAATVQG